MPTNTGTPSPSARAVGLACEPDTAQPQDTESAGASLLADFEARLSQTIAAYDADAIGYTERFQHVDLTAHRQRFLRSLRGPNAVVLDAGCGPGRDIGYFVRDGVRAVGIDRSFELLRIARKQGHQVVEADLRNIPMESETFSGVWACASLVHLSPLHIRSALAEFKRVLRPHGNLFLSVRHGSGIEQRADTSGITRWFYMYSLPLLEELLLESGFVDIDAHVEAGVAHGTWINAHARSGDRYPNPCSRSTTRLQ
jgi:SAM-dependent methyltransferase